uniref:(northern house mosquito) hypothetical protein n=1 Tax=Culex pipiens TaxID=7175 RepID=A0A8D8AMM0_CULPI
MDRAPARNRVPFRQNRVPAGQCPNARPWPDGPRPSDPPVSAGNPGRKAPVLHQRVRQGLQPEGPRGNRSASVRCAETTVAKVAGVFRLEQTDHQQHSKVAGQRNFECGLFDSWCHA